MKIGLLGIGTVGGGVMEQISHRSDLSIKRILVRRDVPELGPLATQNFDDILNDPEIETIVEVIGGIHPAYDYVLRALQAGKHVVTANKLMLSYHMDTLLQAARENGVCLKFDASVGGGIPYLHNLMRSGCADRIHSLFGIVNGTTNLILDTMQTTGEDFADVLAQAQRAGYAEADPSADIDGIDTRSKLCVSCAAAFHRRLNPDEVAMAGIRTITGEDIQRFKRLDLACRLLMRAQLLEDGRVSAFVEPTLLSAGEPETTVHRCNNLIGLIGDHSGLQYFFGEGAGREPTALSVMSGLIEIMNGIRADLPPLVCTSVDNSRIVHRYYVRTASRLSVAAEKLSSGKDTNVYLTEPLSVDRMHALAATLRMRDPNLFFAGVRG